MTLTAVATNPFSVEMRTPRHKAIVQAGALPYRRGADGSFEVLLVTSRRRGNWIIPKGHVERSLGPGLSAAREAEEEAGVVGRIRGGPAGVYETRKLGRAYHVDVYDLEVKRELTDWPERGQRERAWLPLRSAARRVRSEVVARLILDLPKRVQARSR